MFTGTFSPLYDATVGIIEYMYEKLCVVWCLLYPISRVSALAMCTHTKYSIR